MSRSIFGWDLPPGCSMSDIPGNRPEDQKAEAFYDAFFEMEEKARATNPDLLAGYVEEMTEWAWKKMGEAYGEGYAQGQSDEADAKQLDSIPVRRIGDPGGMSFAYRCETADGRASIVYAETMEKAVQIFRAALDKEPFAVRQMSDNE